MKRLLLQFMVFVTVVSFALVNRRASAQAPTPVKVAMVVEAEGRSARRVVGTVRPLRTTTIGSAVEGRVSVFPVNQGQAVTKNQVLCQLLENTARIELAAADAELDLFQQELLQLKNGSRPEDVAEAQANMMAAKARLQNASRQLERTKALSKTKAASKSALDDAQQRYESAEFTLQATEALLKRIKSGPRSETLAQGTAKVNLQKERRRLLEDRLEKLKMRAPFDGYVSAEFTEIGAWISRGDPIVQLIQLDEVEIQCPVTAESAIRMNVGEEIRVEFPELPNELLTGTVENIVPFATDRSRTYPVTLRMKNPLRDDKRLLMAGMLARVQLPAGNREMLPVVPKDALVLNGSDRSVYVVTPHGKDESGQQVGSVTKVTVTLGIALGDGIQVKGNLKAGDIVVTVGNERLTPTSKVTILPNRTTTKTANRTAAQ